MISALPSSLLPSLLLTAAQAHPDISSLITFHHQSQLDAEAARTLNFDQHSKTAWYILNKKYGRLSGSRQYEAVYDAR
ncbi:hypothetical protein B0T21DRAFT_187640 [Apiosordaria backusii]|uniref:Uncharacterized protein n=1 Tax=Apiosordaria backusii TaxID=314023 RepID=A0AA40EBL3_9PEZI|nr:hypothetical protein B0T21DRAFT_187640 [Apiosordaria backusii]